MKSFKSIISFILSLILMMLVFIFQISIFTSTKLYNSSLYTSNIAKSGLIDYTYESINANLQNLGRTVNLPQTLFNNLFDKQWVKAQLYNSTDNTVKYMAYKTDTLYKVDVNSQADKFNSNLDEFIKSNKLKIDKNAENELKKIKSNVNGIIQNQVLTVDFNSIAKNQTFENARRLLYSVYSSRIIFGIGIIVILALLLLVNMKKVSSFSAWAGYAFVAGGLLCIIPAAFGLGSKFINDINISVQAIKSFIILVTNDFLNYLLISGIFTLLVGVILIVLSIILERFNYTNKKREEGN